MRPAGPYNDFNPGCHVVIKRLTNFLLEVDSVTELVGVPASTILMSYRSGPIKTGRLGFGWPARHTLFCIKQKIIRAEYMKWSLRADAAFMPLRSKDNYQSAPAENSTISCYINEIPDFVKAEMESLYQNAFSSTLAEHVDSSNTSTYVVSVAGLPTTIFLFQFKKKQVRILNAAIKIKPEEIRQFANYVFGQYKSVTSIMFQSIQTDRLILPFPYQQFNSSEDIVLTLPDSTETYFKHLGKNMRRNIRRYSELLLHRFPSYRFQVYENEKINEQHIRNIIDLNAARMQDKNKIQKFDDELRNWVIKMAKTYGCMGVATINGRICAGVVCSRVGESFFMVIIAHDPAYNEFRLGTLCCYQMICEAIARGGKDYHFLWGQGDYKYWFLGVQHDLDNVTIYRSRVQYFLNLDLVFRNAFHRYIRHVKRHLEKQSNTNNISSRLLATILRCLRTSQQLKYRMVVAIKKLILLSSRK